MDVAWADAYPGHERALGEIFSLVFVKGVDEVEALRRLGGLPGTVATRALPDIGELHDFDHGYPTVAAALQLDGWTVVVEPEGFESSHLVTAVSAGTEAISVLRHDYASPGFVYARDGQVITGFDPTRPDDRYGTDPGHLLPAMTAAGFTAEAPRYERVTSRSLLLAHHLTGVLPTYEALTAPLLSAQFEPWFTGVSPGSRRPGDPAAEVRRLAGELGLLDVLSGVLAEPTTVTPTSALGAHVLDWLKEASRASWSLNDHSGRHRMTDADRKRGYDLGWLLASLGAVVRPQPAESI